MTERRNDVPDDRSVRRSGTRAPDPADTEADLANLVSYEEEDGLVVCDRENPRAWIKADSVEPLRE